MNSELDDSKAGDQQRAAVREDWAGRALHWDRHAEMVAEPAERLNQPLIEAADIQTGQTVLDIATGSGEPGLTVAKLIGANGHLTMSDMVPEMIAGAERRATDQGLTNIDYMIADMADLPREANTYDRVISRFGLMFCPNKETAVSEAFRVLKPGGRAAWMVWGPKSNNSSFAFIDEAAKNIFGADNPKLDVDLPFSLSESGALETLLRDAGFETKGEVDIKLHPKLPTDRPFWSAMVDMMVGRPRDAASEDERAAFDRQIKTRFGDLIKDGRYHIHMHARICSGVKSA